VHDGRQQRPSFRAILFAELVRLARHPERREHLVAEVAEPDPAAAIGRGGM
jgi:hypothetical protein